MSPEESQEEVRRLQEALRVLQEYSQSLKEQEQLCRELLAVRDATIAQQTQKLEELNSVVEHLRRMLFGPKSEKMTQEQETELAAVAGDLTDQTQRPAADADEVLQEEAPEGNAEPALEPPPRRKPRTRQMPANLEVQTTVLEPTEPPCAQCGRMGQEIGREVSEQVDLIPAKLILRRTVRIQRQCQCGCGTIAIAPLPAQLLPSSKLGLGLAVFILLSKYDDHLALYTLERIFRERHKVTIPRQQMVQWI